MNIWQLYFGFKGRISKEKYNRAGWFLFPLIVLLMLATIFLFFGQFPKRPLLAFLLTVILLLIVSNCIQLPLLAKRIHDFDQSAKKHILTYWFASLLQFLFLIFAISGQFILLGIIMLVFPIVTIYLHFILKPNGIDIKTKDGTPGPNKYGPDPLAKN